jgi:membrane protein
MWRPLRRGGLGTLRTLWAVVLFLLQRDASLLAAGLAFFAMVSIAPFIVLAVATAGLVFGADSARAELHARITAEVGPEVAQFVTSLARDAANLASLSVASLFGTLILLWGSTRLFMEVRRALHVMFQIPAPLEGGFRGAALAYLRGRLFAALGTLLFGAFFLALLGLKYALDFALGPSRALWAPLEGLTSLGLLAALVALVFKLLPDRSPRRAALWIGAVSTALLLFLGRALIAWYISAGAIGTAYGAAGSAIVFLVWAYWSSLGFLFGARLAWALELLWQRRAAAPLEGA